MIIQIKLNPQDPLHLMNISWQKYNHQFIIILTYDDILVLSTLIMWGRTPLHDNAEQIISFNMMIDAKNIIKKYPIQVFKAQV